MKERRMFERFKVDLPVKFLDLNTKKEGAGKIIDISPSGGGMIVTTEPIGSSTPLEMQFLIPDNKGPLTANGKVVWSRTIEPNICMVGIQFEKLDFMGIARVLRLHKMI